VAREPVGRRSALGLAALIGLLGVLLAHRAALDPRLPRGLLVEVAGDVARPGTLLVHQATVRAAVAAAGGPAVEGDAPLSRASLVVVHGGHAEVHPAEDPWLLGAPVDLNRADAAALVTVPGVGPATASAILDHRRRRGPFHAVRELAWVRGIGPDTVTRLSPRLTVGDVGPRAPPAPLDVNRASAASLERLPGIGPTRAAAIVADRAEHGRFADLDALARVRGIGLGTIAGLHGHAIAGRSR